MIIEKYILKMGIKCVVTMGPYVFLAHLISTEREPGSGDILSCVCVFPKLPLRPFQIPCSICYEW